MTAPRGLPRWLALTMMVVGMAGFLAGAPAAWSAPRAQRLIQPGDVATPTPTYAVILVPTATPTPVAPSPLVGAGTAAWQAPSQYVVRDGDTLLTVALEIGVDVSEMPCLIAPTFQITQPLVIGDVIPIPGWLGAGVSSTGYRPMRCHLVAAGETVAQIAEQYGVSPELVRAEAWNGLAQVGDDAPLPAGRYVRIMAPLGEAGENGFLAFMLAQPVSVSPLTAYAVGGPRAAAPAGPVPKDWPYGSGVFAWPVYGWLSQGYREDHRAVDIAAPGGTFVTAADRGVVVRAGWNDQGYGLFVVIDHNIDYITLYSHLSDVLVREGDVVAQGQVIGTVGSTGNSTGPHLHFEIRDFGRRANPLDYLVR